jgi:hypothetical protein
MPLFRRLLSLVTRVRRTPPAPLRIDHPVLGHLSGTAEVLEGSLQFGSQRVRLHIRPDTQPIEAVFALALTVTEKVGGFHAKALTEISNTYLAMYNDTWRFGSQTQPDGTEESFEHPFLSSTEFLSRFLLDSVSVTGTTHVELWYTCGDLFWGHDVSVLSSDGATFEDLYAALQG